MDVKPWKECVDLMFTFKGRTSSDMGLVVERSFALRSPERSIEKIAIDGRDGVLTIDRGRYESVIWNIPVFLRDDVDIERRLINITDWLLTDVGYHDFLWGADGFVYRAMCHQSFNIDRILRTFGRGVINFTLHPVKFLREGLVERAVVNNANINNPYGINAKPRFRIIGGGNITISIGSQRLVLVGIGNGGCIVDSETQTITSLDGHLTLFDRMNSYPFPELMPGNNVFSVPDGIQLHLIPRLGALV